MTHGEALQIYSENEFRLDEIASSQGMTTMQITKEFKHQPLWLRDLMRPILEEQLECLDEMKRHRYKDYSNVLVFPLSSSKRNTYAKGI